jgi:uncharacterized membrane protein YeaQ/YmgE (transglycosylase-associated protein family)
VHLPCSFIFLSAPCKSASLCWDARGGSGFGSACLALCHSYAFRNKLKETAVYLSNEGVIMILLVGLIAGWLAGKIVRGTGIGLIGDMAIGIVGAFIASWLLPRLGIGLGAGLIRAVINATIGAALLLIMIRLARA